MKTRRVALGVAAAVLVTGAFLAPAEAARSRKPLRTMTCHDFLSMEDGAKPEMVYWAATYGRDGRPEGTVVDVDDTDRIVPALVEACKQAPGESFWRKVRGAVGKLDRTLRDGETS